MSVGKGIAVVGLAAVSAYCQKNGSDDGVVWGVLALIVLGFAS